VDAPGRDLIGDGGSLAVEAYRERLLSAFRIGPGRGKKALDLGCGDGLEAVYLARLGYSVLALDLQAHPRWKALEKEWKGRIRFKVADAAKLKSLKPGFDLAFEKDMLHHVDEPPAVLAEMKRLLKKGGKLYIAECNRYNPIFYVHLTLLGGHQHFSRGRLKALLGAAGMPGYRLALREARVFPFESAAFQKLMDRLQDLIERLRVLDPILCYNLVSWSKPRG
jgi:ubiquinone/menaquinone biosynthesis C-methylase UbiE